MSKTGLMARQENVTIMLGLLIIMMLAYYVYGLTLGYKGRMDKLNEDLKEEGKLPSAY